jgi:hypothetical protein
MADEIKIVVVAADLIFEGVQEDSAVRELLDHNGFALRVTPRGEKLVPGVVGVENPVAGVVTKGFGDQVAVFVEVLNALVADIYFYTIHDVAAARGGGVCGIVPRGIGFLLADRSGVVIALPFGLRRSVRFVQILIIIRLIDYLGIAVKVGELVDLVGHAVIGAPTVVLVHRDPHHFVRGEESVIDTLSE